MVSKDGLTRPIVIDPYLNWKTSSRRRQSAVRRPRTSFTLANRKRSTIQSLSGSGDLIASELKRAGDMPASEAEKLGASILGRCFSDTLAFVPVKKKRVRIVHSQLPPSQLSSHLYELGQDKFAKNGNTNLKELNEKLCELPDFSGISLLASVACDSNMLDGILNTDVSVSERHSSEGGITRSAEPHILPEIKEGQLFSTSGYLDVKTNIVGSMYDVQNTASKAESSFHNDRFHWDLNTVMDLWERPHEVVNANSPDADGEYGIGDEKLLSMEPCHDQVGHIDAKHTPEPIRVHSSGIRKDDSALEESKVPEKPVFTGNSSVEDYNGEKECVSIYPLGDSALEEHQMEDVPVAKTDSGEEKELLFGPSFSVRDARGPESGNLMNIFTSKEENAESYHVCTGSKVETETPSSLLIPIENASINLTTHASESLPRLDQRATVVVPEVNTCSVYVTDLDIHSGGCPLTNVETQAEYNTSLRTDLKMGKINQCSNFRHLAEDASDVLVDRNSACQIIAHSDGIFGEVAHIDALDNNPSDPADNSKLDMSSRLSDFHPFTCRGSSYCDELSSGSTSAGELVPDIDPKMNNHECSMLADESFNTTKYDDPIHTGSNISICDSAATIHGIADALPIDGDLSSHETCKSYVDNYVNRTGEVALEDHSDCDYNSYASQTGTDQAIAPEKVELLTDDDSQYEDGEFRGSMIISWGEDEAEDGETEFVECRSRNVVDDACIHFDNFECKNVRLSEVGNDHCNGIQVGKSAQERVPQSVMQGPLVDISGTGCGKRAAGMLTKNSSRGHHNVFSGIEKVERNAKYTLESDAVSDMVIGHTEISKESVGARESIRSASLSLKSCWDQLPGPCRSSRHGVVDAGFGTSAMLDAPGVSESLRRAVGSTFRKNSSSRVERPRSSVVSHGKGKYYARPSRSDVANEPLKLGDVENVRSFKRGKLSLRMHDRGRGDHWVDSGNHWDPKCCDSQGHGQAGFTLPGSKNALAAVAAKLESNGFVIAPDGTLLKAGGPGPTDCALRRSIITSSQKTCVSVRRRSPNDRDGAFDMPRGLRNLRERSPDGHSNVCRSRTGRYGPGMVRTSRREQNNGHQSLSRRDQSFSPYRRSLLLCRSHTRSPSRSRTRSPMWTSRRESGDRGMTRSPGLRRCSRPPSYIRPEVAQKRMRSPHWRPGFKRMVGYIPSSGNHTSPPHASRTDERKESLEQFKEHEYRRASERRPPTRGFSQDHKVHPLGSPKRSKPDD